MAAKRHKMLKKKAESNLLINFLLFLRSLCLFAAINSGKFCARPARFVAFTAEDGAADLGLKRYLVVLAAMVANDLEPFRSAFADRGLFGTALRAPLRRHHITLIEGLLLFFGEKKGLFALNTRSFHVRHHSFSFLL